VIGHGGTNVYVAEEILGECPDREKFLSGLIINRILCVTQAEEKPPLLVLRNGERIAPGATMEETLRYAMDLSCEYANFYSLMAYPGSGLYADASQEKGVLPDGWAGFSQLGYEAKPLPSEYLSSEEILRFRDRAFKRYFTNPKYLAMINTRFGVRALRHVEDMAKIGIKRMILEEDNRR